MSDYRKKVKVKGLDGKERVLTLTAPPFDPNTLLPRQKFPKSVTRDLLISLVTDVREQGYA